MLALVAWFVVAEVGALASLILALPLLAVWFIVAGAWATVQYDDGWTRTRSTEMEARGEPTR